MDPEIIVAIVTAGGVLLSAIVAYIVSQADKEANQAEQISEAWSRLMQPYTQELAALRERVLDLETELARKDARIVELESEVKILQQQVRDLGGSPRSRLGAC